MNKYPNELLKEIKYNNDKNNLINELNEWNKV